MQRREAKGGKCCKSGPEKRCLPSLQNFWAASLQSRGDILGFYPQVLIEQACNRTHRTHCQAIVSCNVLFPFSGCSPFFGGKFLIYFPLAQSRPFPCTAHFFASGEIRRGSPDSLSLLARRFWKKLKRGAADFTIFDMLGKVALLFLCDSALRLGQRRACFLQPKKTGKTRRRKVVAPHRSLVNLPNP